MAIRNSVSSYFLSTFIDTNVFDCRLSSVIKYSIYLNSLHAGIFSMLSNLACWVCFLASADFFQDYFFCSAVKFKCVK